MTGLDDEAFRSLCQTLQQEAEEQVERMGKALMQLERGEGDERMVVGEAFREAHNLKGAAGSLGFVLTGRLAHAIETALTALTDADGPRRELFDVLHRGIAAVAGSLKVDPGVESEASVDGVIAELEAVAGGDTDARGSSVDREARTYGPPPMSEAPEPPPIPPAPLPMSAQLTQAETIPESIRAKPAPSEPAPSEPAPSEPAREASAPEAPMMTMSMALPPQEETIRVSVTKLGALMQQVGELLSARLRVDQRLAELRQLLSTEEARLSRLVTMDSKAIGGNEAWSRHVRDQQELVKAIGRSVRAFEADAVHSSILSGELQEHIRKIQTFPLASLLDPVPRAVRNMAGEAEKVVDVVIHGADVEVDKKVLGALRDPLYHLLRNAVDHGIEKPSVRRGSGKSERGTISIRADHRGSSIVISVEDDGAGVDLPKVRDRAVKLGLVERSRALSLPGHRILDFLFAPGMTTKDKAGSLSGRGIGLDAVRAAIEALHGTISLENRPGHGTTFVIVLPLSIYVVHALILRAGGRRYALPIASVDQILRSRREDLVDVEGCPTVVFDSDPVAVIELAEVLGSHGAPADRGAFLTLIIIGAGRTRFALVVDDIEGDESLLAKSFEPPLMRVRHIAGASVISDGSVVLMLNPVDLIRSASAFDAGALASSREAAEPTRTPRLLLVDDSLTTRTLERSVLELAGFEVVACADGQEALERLERGGPFDLVMSDVQMPRMGGLELCRRIRATAGLEGLPVVLVTSLGSPEDRQNGMVAGADAYIVKLEFDHRALVARVNELLGRA